MLGKIVVVGLQRPDQIRHRCRGVRELTSVSLLKADHREVTRPPKRETRGRSAFTQSAGSQLSAPGPRNETA